MKILRSTAAALAGFAVGYMMLTKNYDVDQREKILSSEISDTQSVDFSLKVFGGVRYKRCGFSWAGG